MQGPSGDANDADDDGKSAPEDPELVHMYESKEALETARTADEENLEDSDDNVDEDDPVAAANMLTWRKGFVVGEKRPTKRSGHTFTVLGSNAFLFGGCDAQSPAGPTGELWQLKMLGNFEWIRLDDQVNKAGGLPVARWLHSACVYDKKFMLIFGGFHSSKRRLNDLWMFDTITLQWTLLSEGSAGLPGKGDMDGTNTARANSGGNSESAAPPPRGGHSASIVEDKMWVFGGYGGQGYARRDHNDLFVLSLGDMRWQPAPPLKGQAPRPRSGHTASVVDACVYIYGGWNAMEQLSDLCVLDTHLLTWSSLDTFMDPRWGHTACSVEAIPYWKIFYFGGCTGNLQETKRAQGALSSRVLTLDTGTCVFDRPKVRGDLPCGRADTTFGYDAKSSRLVMFGGWANQWLDDIYTLDVGCVVGPPYAILGIFPRQGPLTGGTALMITGQDFVHDPQDPRIKVRFIAKGGYIIDAPGEFVNGETITCIAPDFDALLQGQADAAQLEVDVRVAFRDDSFTVTSQKFTFISVTVAEKCLAYGPGLLRGGCPGVPTMFVIHANDVTGAQRATGGDDFVVRIAGDDVAVLDATIEDNEDGSYAVEYTAPLPGEYVIEVEYAGTFRDDTGQQYDTGKSGHIRGSPFTVDFVDGAAKSSNKMNGPLLRETMDRKFQDTKKLVTATRVQLQKAVGPGYAAELAADIKAVIAVKEKVHFVETERAVVELDIDLFECIARHLAESYGVKSDKRLREIAGVRQEWNSITEGQPNLLTQATAALRPHVLAHGDKTQAQLLDYETSVLAYERSIKHFPCFSWSAGPEGGMNSLAEAIEAHETRLVKHAEMKKLAKLFEFPALCHGASSAMDRVEKTLHHAQDLWEVAADALIFMDESKGTPWRNVKPALLEEEARKRSKTVKALPAELHDTDAFLGLEREVKNFLLTCPLISHLGSEAMRARHWDELRAAIGKSFTSPAENKKMRLGDVVDLNLHEVAAQVEDIANKATKEAKVEAALTKIERSWTTTQFTEDDARFEAADAPPYLSLPADDVAGLEADQAAVEAMASSAHASPFMEAYTTAEGIKCKGVKYWKSALSSLLKVVTSLESMQRAWAYLESLFMLSDEVKQALPDDTKRFAALDADVRKLLEDASKTKLVLVFCTKPGRADTMEEVNEQLEVCKRSLGNFLASKCASFPRFYFAAESQVLDILSNGSKPAEVIKLISAVFPAISSLQVEGVYASHWISADQQECGAFDSPVILKGKVEGYLRDVETSCQQALRTSLAKSLTRYKSQQRKDWIVHKVENGLAAEVLQIALLVCRIIVTQEIEAAFGAIKSGNRDALRDYFAKIKQQLADMAKAARQPTLTIADRTRIASALALDVHTRDLVEDFVRRSVTSRTSFDWQRQIKQRASGATEICSASFDYGFEYVGHYPRMLPTPTFDQAVLMASHALQLQVGCAIRGGPVSGKSELVRELGATLGKYCHLYNCAPDTDMQALGSLFTGMAATGAWVCLDAFERLANDVVAACAAQLKRLCDARRGGVASVSDDFAPQGSAAAAMSLALDPGFALFATLGAPSASSTLPMLSADLRAYLRPVATFAPDTRPICEALLLASGFAQAPMLASKVHSFFTLCRETLPPRPCYAWGLRSLRAVLALAGDLRRGQKDDADETVALVQALRDSVLFNIDPSDMAVFTDILRSLFPVEAASRLDEDLDGAVKEASAARELWPDQDFLSRVVYLEDLLTLRQSVFIVGAAGAGKSECWRTLQRAHQLLKRKTSARVIYPQALTLDTFFGYLAARDDWRDGVLARTMRELASAPVAENAGATEQRWIVLDGEITPYWFETMNSVFDDIKVLTLASGENVPLRQHTRFLLEVADLAHASPSSVSRAAILHLSTAGGAQWKALVASWIQRKEWDDHIKEAISTLFQEYLGIALAEFDKGGFRPLVPISHTQRVTALLAMLEAVIGADEKQLVEIPGDLKEATQALEPCFAFCMVWALGAPLAEFAGSDLRRELSGWWKTTFKNVKFPARETVFDYFLDVSTGKFELWKNSPQFTAALAAVNPVEGRPPTSVHEIYVPTPESASLTFWLERMIALEQAVLLVGVPGTGKSCVIRNALRDLDAAEQPSTCLPMHHLTTAFSLQEALEAHLEKKSGSLWGPPGEDKQLVVFVDDIHLPQQSAMGAQQALESLRQQMDAGQVVDRTSLGPRHIQRCQFLASMTQSESEAPSARFQRHYVTFALGFPSARSLQTIYGAILAPHLKRFDDSVKALETSLVEAAAGLHLDMMAKLRASAATPHYEFNLRHLTRVFQGILMAQPAAFNDATSFVKLWCHESERVYSDGLVSAVDRIKFRDLLLGQAKRKFPSFSLAKHLADDDAEPVVACHFAPAGETASSDDDAVYNLVGAYQDLEAVLAVAIEEVNSTKTPSDIVLFDEAIAHVCRIARVLQCTRGHGLLVGPGGCGKSSLARLAAHVSSVEMHELGVGARYGVQDLKEDLRSLCTQVGVNGQRLCVLVRDRQLARMDKGCFVHLADMIDQAERIAPLFSEEEQESIAQSVAVSARAAGRKTDLASCFAFFVDRVRDNLHWLFALDPAACEMRTWLRTYPALMRTTVVNWFHPWPERALRSVARRLLAEVDLETDELRQGVETFMLAAYASSCRQTCAFSANEGLTIRQPLRAFVDCQRAFARDLAGKRQSNRQKRARLESVAERMREAGRLVDSLEETIRAQEEDADEKTMLADAQAEEVARDAAVVATESLVVDAEQAKVDEIAAEAQAIRDDSQAEFDKAEPLLKKALDALDLLTKKDLGECKSMSSTPKGVDDVFCAVLILLAGVDPRIVVNKSGKPASLSWENCKKELMGNINEFLNQLKAFKEAVEQFRVPKVNWANVRPIIQLEQFAPETVERKNKAAGALASWVECIVAYYDAILCVEPKRQVLQEVEARLAKAAQVLDKVKAKVGELEVRLAKLRVDLDEANALRDEAVQRLRLSELRLGLARRLTAALSSETERWAASIDDLDTDFAVVLGNTLMTSCFGAYAGPLPSAYRNTLVVQDWLPVLTQAAAGEPIPVSADFRLAKEVATPAEMAAWQCDGLPSDATSIENGALIMRCSPSRWSLLLDPELHGLAWLRRMRDRQENSWTSARVDDPELAAKLAAAIAAGQTFILEDVRPELGADIEALVLRRATLRGARTMIQLGAAGEVELLAGFRLILHTACAHAAFPADMLSACSLVNFTASSQGLEDQFLRLVVRKEHGDLSAQNAKLGQLYKQLSVRREDLEDAILVSLADADGDVCADEHLIEELESSKTRLASIAQMQTSTEANGKQLEEFFAKYRPVAKRGTLLFSTMREMHKLDASYKFSLNAFVSIFLRGIDLVTKPPEPTGDDDNKAGGMADRLRAKVRHVVSTTRFAWDEDALLAETRAEIRDLEIGDGITGHLDIVQEVSVEGFLADAEVDERCSVLNRSVTNMVFTYLRYGVREVHALSLAAHLCFHIMHAEGDLDPQDVDALVRCRPVTNPGSMGPLSSWMPAPVWAKLKGLETTPGLQSIGDEIMTDSDEWREWFLSRAPEEKRIPGELGELDEHKRLLIVLAIRPDRLCKRLSSYISSNLGALFVDRQSAFDMDGALQVSSPSAPILLVSSEAVDAMALVQDLAVVHGKKIVHHSSSTQEDLSEARLVVCPAADFERAEAAILASAEKGYWVMLQNIHFAEKELPRLERLLRQVAPSAHDDFRCFMSVAATNVQAKLPELLVASAVKVVWDAGMDLETNLEASWARFPQSRIDGCASNRFQFQQALFALCLFHAMALGRGKCGALGWTRACSFSDAEINLAVDALERYVASPNVEPSAIAWKELRCAVGEFLYGGLVQDSRDLDLLRAQLARVWQPKLVAESKSAFELAPGFRAPEEGLSHKQVQTFCKKNMPKDCPELYGLKSFVDQPYWVARQARLCQDLELLGGLRSPGAALEPDDRAGRLRSVVKALVEKLPGTLDLQEAHGVATPLLAEKAQQTPFILVALQEAGHLNALVALVRATLDEVQKALDGLINPSSALVLNEDALLAQRVPAAWAAMAGPSPKPLDGWVDDLVTHADQLRGWMQDFVLPKSFWLPGFFRPLALLSALKQVTARKQGVALEDLTLAADVTLHRDPSTIDAPPSGDDGAEAGIYVHGLSMEGGRYYLGDATDDALEDEEFFDDEDGQGPEDGRRDGDGDEEEDEDGEGGHRYMVGKTRCGGFIVQSGLKAAAFALPVVLVRAVPTQPTWTAAVGGYLRDDDESVFACPVYATSVRCDGGDDPTDGLLFLATLKTRVPSSQWVLANLSIVLRPG